MAEAAAAGRLAGKAALVTGATSGIGRAIAERFGREGAKVAVNYRAGHANEAEDRARADEAVQAVKDAGGQAVAVGADVSNRDHVERMVADTVAAFGRLDIAVNCAGIQMQKPFLEVTPEEWHAVLGVNLHGAFYVTQASARVMAKQEPLPGREARGRIINISSTHEDIAFPGFTAYCASKGGLRMLTRNLAVELAPLRITINNIAPGAIATPINKDALKDSDVSEQVVKEVPWGRWGRAEEVAALAAFLAGDETDYITGATLYQDGGLSQQVTEH